MSQSFQEYIAEKWPSYTRLYLEEMVMPSSPFSEMPPQFDPSIIAGPDTIDSVFNKDPLIQAMENAMYEDMTRGIILTQREAQQVLDGK